MNYVKTQYQSSLSDTIRTIKSKGQVLPNGHIFLTNPIFGFKKVVTSSDPYPRLSNLEVEEYLRKNNECLYWEEASIANLVIPAGSMVRLPNNSSGKIRASQALCYSIKTVKNGKTRRVAASQRSVMGRGRSFYFSYEWGIDTTKSNISPSFDKQNFMDKAHQYRDHETGFYGRSLTLPSNGFDGSNLECAAGIHFFIDIERAINW